MEYGLFAPIKPARALGCMTVMRSQGAKMGSPEEGRPCNLDGDIFTLPYGKNTKW